MVGILIKVVIGLVLFTGSLVGGLAATGRLNHEGTANIPVLNGFFPEPPPEEGAEGEAADAHGDGHGAPAEGAHTGEHGVPTDASSGQEPQGPRKRVVGKSVLNPEPEKGGGGHGGGHGEEPAGHGEDAGHGDTGHGADAAHPPAAPHGETAGGAHGEHGQDEHEVSDAERDFRKLEQAQGRTGYEPGAYFRFEGMPSGLTPEQINEAWQSVQGILQGIEQRKTALDLREQELQELGNDISHRWKQLAERHFKIEQMQRALDDKIAKFEQTVRLIKNDEVAKLKRNAESMASFERSKAAEIVQQQWATERGQDEILRLLEFMDKDAVNEILAELPNPMVQDVMDKRMQISKEAKASEGRD